MCHESFNSLKVCAAFRWFQYNYVSYSIGQVYNYVLCPMVPAYSNVLCLMVLVYSNVLYHMY